MSSVNTHGERAARLRTASRRPGVAAVRFATTSTRVGAGDEVVSGAPCRQSEGGLSAVTGLLFSSMPGSLGHFGQPVNPSTTCPPTWPALGDRLQVAELDGAT